MKVDSLAGGVRVSVAWRSTRTFSTGNTAPLGRADVLIINTVLLEPARVGKPAYYCIAESLDKTARAARQLEALHWERAILEKRITIRRRNKQRRVDILSPVELAQRTTKRGLAG